jgi:hypothetical protein
MIDQDGVVTTDKVPKGPIPSEAEWKAEHAHKNGENWYYMQPPQKAFHSIPFSCRSVLETV